jgi:Ca-activated chloride channel family protein
VSQNSTIFLAAAAGILAIAAPGAVGFGLVSGAGRQAGEPGLPTSAPQDPAPQGQFASGVNVVEVYATVTDPGGEPLRGLTKGDFVVREDGQEQQVSTFAAADFPLSVALAIDRSFSMSGERLALAKSAARAFLGELRATDESMLIAVGSRIEVIAPLSRDRQSQFGTLSSLDAFGTTGLHDAIISAIDEIQGAQGRRALVLLSDGADKYSQATADAALERARRSDVMVYPVALGRERPELFAEIATLTGGRSFHLRNPKDLVETLRAVARELREQYLLGYSPSRPIAPDEEGWRSIEVTVNRPGARVRARDGYMVTSGSRR